MQRSNLVFFLKLFPDLLFYNSGYIFSHNCNQKIIFQILETKLIKLIFETLLKEVFPENTFNRFLPETN
jgi:hypothetical protein